MQSFLDGAGAGGVSALAAAAISQLTQLDAAALPKVAAALAEALAVMHSAGDLWLSYALPPTDLAVLWAEEPPASVAAADGKPRKSAAEMTASLFPLPGGGGSISGSRRSHVAVAEPRADASSELQG